MWVDVNRESSQRDPEYPTAGLYIDDKFIMGVPHNYVPEYSIAALDFNMMIREGKYKELNKALETGYCEDEKILWRGWRAIVSGLIRLEYCTKEKAEKVFNTHFNTHTKEYPRNYVNRQL